MKHYGAMALAAALSLSAQTVCAEELLIQLKSGNTIKVTYDGTIQGVALDGKADAIEGFRIEGRKPVVQSQAVTTTPQSSGSAAQPAVASAAPAEGAKAVKQESAKDSNDGGWFKLKWAPPKSED